MDSLITFPFRHQYSSQPPMKRHTSSKYNWETQQYFPSKKPSIQFGISQGPLERKMGGGHLNLHQHDHVRNGSHLPDQDVPGTLHTNELQGIGEIPG